MTPTKIICPQCNGAGQVHRSLYERSEVPVLDLQKAEETWRKGKLNTDYTCKVSAESLKCRVCWGTGSL